MAPVAGIDRWRGGWVAAIVEGPALVLHAAACVDAMTEVLEPCTHVTVDMPIALATTGRRAGEADLRAMLGASGRSVFTSPTRSAVEATSQSAATDANRRAGGPGISAQAYGLFASIRELREHLLTNPDARWFETHPETSFAVMHGGTPMASKRTAVGVGQRFAALREHFPAIDETILAAPERVPIDDVLDAIAAAWSAQRLANGQAMTLGPDIRDDQGLPLGIKI